MMWFRLWWSGHPFHLRGAMLWFCFFCQGWGSDDRGYECPICYGQGWPVSGGVAILKTLLTKCTDCDGKGRKVRVADDLHPHMSQFPLLCDRCGGSGMMPRPPLAGKDDERVKV